MELNDNSRDASAKRILSDKYIAAAILKECVVEVENMSLEEIVGLLPPIDSSEPFIMTLDPEIHFSATKKVILDILFEIMDKNIYIDLEPESADKHMMNYSHRGQLYCAGNIVKQYSERDISYKTGYQNFRKNYTIFIHIVPLNLDKEYSIEKEFFAIERDGKIIERSETGLSEVVHIYLGDDYKACEGVLSILTLIFRSQGNNESIDVLKKRLNFPVSGDLEEDIRMYSFKEHVEAVAKKRAQEMAVDMAADMAKDMAADMAKDMAEGMAKDMAKEIAQGMAKNIATDMAKGMAEDMAKDIAEDMAKNIAEDIAKDMAQGMAEGIAQERTKEIARKLLLKMSVEEVSALTDISVEDLKNL